MKMSLLSEIIASKHKEIERLEQNKNNILANLANDERSLRFTQALKRNDNDRLRVIAESKRASPSRGLLCENYNPEKIARQYKACGASAVSVLTDNNFFRGQLEHLSQASRAGLPLLMKDFIIHPLQIYQAKNAGASALLLIVRILSQQELKSLFELAYKTGLAVLVEVHNEKELEQALNLDAEIIGINHRDLDTLKINLELSAKLSEKIREHAPKTIVVAESGLENRDAIKKVEKYADAVLVGTAFMQEINLSPLGNSENLGDVEKKWQELFG